MILKINGFRAGVLSAMMLIGIAGCKKEGPFAPLPQGLVSQKMEHTVDSFYHDGLKYANNPDYMSVRKDTIKMSNYYAHCPGEFAEHLEKLCHKNNYAVDKNGIEQNIYGYEDLHLVVSSNQIFTTDSINSYIAVEEYAKKVK